MAVRTGCEPTMQVAQTVEPLQSESQADQQPDQEQAALGDGGSAPVHSVLGIIKPWFSILPAAFGHG